MEIFFLGLAFLPARDRALLRSPTLDHPKRAFSASNAGDGPDAPPELCCKMGVSGRFAMGSVLVVVPAPIPQLLPGVFKAHEPVGVQAFRPQLAVERFDEGVVGGLFEAAQVQCDAMGTGPQVQIARDELRSLIDADCAGIARFCADSFQGRHHILTAIAEPWTDRRRELREYVDHRQNLHRPAQCQLVMDKLHGPSLVPDRRLR